MGMKVANFARRNKIFGDVLAIDGGRGWRRSRPSLGHFRRHRELLGWLAAASASRRPSNPNSFKNDGVATVQSPSIFQVAESKKVIRELSRMTLKPNCRFYSGSVHPQLGGPRPRSNSAGALTVLERATAGSANRYLCRGRGKLSSIKFWISVFVVAQPPATLYRACPFEGGWSISGHIRCL